MRTRGRIVTCFAMVSLLLVVGVPPSMAGISGNATQASPAHHKIASNLGLLLSLQSEAATINLSSSLGRELAQIQASGLIEVNARFAHELSLAEQATIAALGVQFRHVAGQLAQGGPFYGVLVPVGAVDDLAAYPLTVWLEATWRPSVHAPLDRSITQAPQFFTYVNAPGVWGMTSPFTGLPLTGHGVTIANFDTGVDVRHPAFLDGTYGVGDNTWDTNGDNVFTPNVDQIGGVTLRFWDAQGDPNNAAGVFDVTQDWVYGDANSNSSYDWNETVYMPYDANASGILEASEYLINRGTLGPGIPNSKIAATLNSGATSGVQRTRGVDLEQTAPDTNGHGTSVSGILGAGAAYWSSSPVWPNAQRYTGMAPDADLLVADRINLTELEYIPWALGQGAKVMLYEFGAWVQTYLDGSSNMEQMMDWASTQGVLQVVPTGNLHCAGTSGCNPRHLQYTLPTSAWFTTNSFNVPALAPAITQVYASLLWLHPGNTLTVQVVTPGGSSTGILPCAAAGGGWQYVDTGDGHRVWCERATDSPRGTALYNLVIQRTAGGSVTTGTWRMDVYNPGTSELANFYIADDATSWAFGAGWLNNGAGTETHTATWPSTCDSCLGVASYATRANTIGTIGALSWFSGRGPRFFDGARIVDVAAPGHYDIITPNSQAAAGGSLGCYAGTFGGTSAAGPHAAGLAALIYQYTNGNTTADQVGTAIMRGAATDAFTGAVPNDSWGYGKLRALDGLSNMMHDLGDAPASDNHAGLPMSAYPNVPAHFPAVFGAAVPGPLHWLAGSVTSGPIDSSFGTTVSAEGEADTLFDEDGSVNNIRPTLNLADWDSADDGLLFPGAVPSCAIVPFVLNGVVLPYPSPSPTRYVNAWMDWTTDGDWADQVTCTVPYDTKEWALQDYAVGPGPFVIGSPLATYRGPSGGAPFWIRVTVSEQTAPLNPGTSLADGRGPAQGYAFGETEDYLYPQTDFQAVSLTCSLTVTFTHAPTSSWPVVFTWNFGDGTIVTNPGPDPVHTYAQPGTYTVTLTATHSSNVFSIYTQTVAIGSLPTASFTHDSPACLGQTMHFTDTSANATAWNWNFGGPGTPGGTPQHPTFLYTAAGTYTVTLTAANSCGASIYRSVVTVTQPLSAVVIAGPVALLVGEAAVYTAAPAPPDATNPHYTWDDGTEGVTATYSWDIPGLYTITVTAANECSLVTGTLQVLVSTECMSLTGVSIAGPYHLDVGEVGTYSAAPQPPTATNPAYTWSNGDSGASTTYSWAVTGTYDVVVTATNCQGVVVSATFPVLVGAECISLTGVSVAGPYYLDVGQEGTYSAAPQPPTATNPAYTWSNGDSEASTTYSWAVTGTYDVVVTATNCQGVVVSATFSVLVGVECVSLTGVTIDGPVSLPVGEEGTYLATPQPLTATLPAYLWSDGSIAASTVISWTLPGTYTVAVTATNCLQMVVTDSIVVRVWQEYRVYLPLVLKSF